MICCILREKLLSGMSAEADLHVAKQSTSLIFNARIETPTKVWQVGKTCTCKKKKWGSNLSLTEMIQSAISVDQ